MPSESLTHQGPHKYRRAKLGCGKKVVYQDGKRILVPTPCAEVFRCALPGCPHYKGRDMVIGQKSICWTCGQEMILTSENTRLKYPRHKDCRKKRLEVA